MNFLKRPNIFILIIIITLTVPLLLYNYVFSIYEVVVESEPKFLFTDQNSYMKIYLEPINAMGWKVPLRNVDGSFAIIEGEELVIIESIYESNGVIIVRSLGEPGKVSFSIKSSYSLFPIYFEFQILNKTV